LFFGRAIPGFWVIFGFRDALNLKMAVEEEFNLETAVE